MNHVDTTGTLLDLMLFLGGKKFELTQRQLTVFLICYLDEKPQTVGGLAARTNLSKVAIVRALDRLTALRLILRGSHPTDGRLVLTQRTKPGRSLMREIKRCLDSRETPAPARQPGEDGVVAFMRNQSYAAGKPWSAPPPS